MPMARIFGSVCTSGDGPGLQNTQGRFWASPQFPNKFRNFLDSQYLAFAHPVVDFVGGTVQNVSNLG